MSTPGSPPTPTFGIAGNWELSAKSTESVDNFAGGTTPLGISLTLGSGGSLSGTFDLQVPVPQLCTPTCCGIPFSSVNPALSGTIDENGNVVLKSMRASTGDVLSITAKMSNATLQNGAYAISGGCADKGTISGSKIPALHGTYSGNVSSSANSDNLGVAVTLNQTPTADASGFFHLTGAAKFSGSSCFSTTTIESPSATSTFFAGSEWQAQFIPTGGPPPYIAASGALSPDGKTLTFNYVVTSGSSCDGNYGKGTLTLQ
jgi:hypothetical protein